MLERDLHVHLNADPQIVEYAAQPHQLIFWAPDEAGTQVKRTYTPDMAARVRTGGVVVLDAKAKIFATSEKWRRVEPYIREAYELDHGARFLVLTEGEIRAEPRFNNYQIMLRHRPPGDDPEGELLVRELVHGAPDQLTIGELTTSAGAQGVDEDRTFSALMRMALVGAVKFDHSQPLSPCALIYLEN